MAGTTIWKGSIHFGEETIPVKLHGAVREERIQFHLLHRLDGVKLQQRMICAHEQLPVPAEAQIRGFAVEDGKYIIIDAGELEQTLPEESRLITVHEFVPSGEIPPLFREHVYYLEADTAMATGDYAMLAETLEETELSGICTWTMRKRAYLGALQARGKILRLTTLRHADEVISASALSLGEMDLTERELRIGAELIGQMSAPFAGEKFTDEHQRKLRQLIEQKARGEKLSLVPPRLLQPTSEERLLEALEASLKKAA